MIQQYSTTVEIQLKAVRCKKFFHYCICNQQRKAPERSDGEEERTRRKWREKEIGPQKLSVCLFTLDTKKRLEKREIFKFF
jgi:hypothetical protein